MDLDWQSKMIILESLLATFVASIIFLRQLKLYGNQVKLVQICEILKYQMV